MSDLSRAKSIGPLMFVFVGIPGILMLVCLMANRQFFEAVKSDGHGLPDGHIDDALQWFKDQLGGKAVLSGMAMNLKRRKSKVADPGIPEVEVAKKRLAGLKSH